MAKMNEKIVSPFIVFIDRSKVGRNKTIKMLTEAKKVRLSLNNISNKIAAYIDSGNKTLYSTIPKIFSEYL